MSLNEGKRMKKIEILNDALAGKHGLAVRETAEEAVNVAVDQITRSIFGVLDERFARRLDNARKFSTGGHVTRGEPLIVGDCDREHFVPLSVIEHLPEGWR
jgi:hypothetical protein